MSIEPNKSLDRDKYWFTDIRPVSTIKEMLQGSVEQYPDRPAFWVKRKKGGEYRAVSYRLLWNDVRALSTSMIERGMTAGRIAVTGMNSYEWIVTYLAAVTGGSVIIPIDRELKKDELANILRTSGAGTIFYTDEQAPKLREYDGEIVKVAMRFYTDRTDESISMRDYLESPLYSTVKTPSGCDTTWKHMVAEGEESLAAGSTVYDDLVTDPEKMCTLLFTSGTTGTPKGVMLCQRNILSNIMDTCRIAHITPEDKTLSILPIHHTYECTYGMLLVLYRGASNAFCEGLHYISKNMNECHNTVFIAVPLLLEMIHSKIWKQAEKKGQDKLLRRLFSVSRKLRRIGIDARRKLFGTVLKQLGGTIRMFIIGAASVSPIVIRDFEDMGITVLQGYGLTECTPLVSGTPENARERYEKAGSVGVAVAQGDVKIEDADEDGIGKIFFRGPNVMMGYYEMPEETRAVMHDGWFETGDLGFFDRDGWLYISGRYKNMIVTKTGKNIYPEEIEEVINQLECVSECMVYSAKRRGEEVVACQVLPEMEYINAFYGHEADQDEIYQCVKSMVNEANMTMVSYKRVKEVLIRDHDFIRSTTAKILRKPNVDEMETE